MPQDTLQNPLDLSKLMRPDEQQTGARSNPPPDAPPVPSAEFTPPPDEDETRATAQVDTYDRMQSALKPIQDYKKFLVEQKITEEKAAKVVDDLLSKGYYEETYQVTKALTIAFRTREQRDTMRLQTAMQIQRPLFDAAMHELITRYNMASSLSRYRAQVFKFAAPTTSEENVFEELFNARLSFIEGLSTPIFNLVSIKLVEFDQLIMAIARPGVAENF